MQTTTNYGLKIYEGTDLFNPLTVENVNTSDLDTIVKGVSNAAVGTATELLTGTVHALTRADTARNVFHFTATANYEAGETFEVDGTQVTAKTPDGRNLSTGAYVINSTVLCMLEGTLLTVLVNPAKALDSENLDGHPATYFATAAALSALDNQLGAVSSKVGTGVLDVGNDCVDGINTLNTHLNGLIVTEEFTATNVATVSGGVGTRAVNQIIDIAKSGYTAISVDFSVPAYQNDLINVVAFTTATTAQINLYKANSNTLTNVQPKIKVVYVKNS